MSGYYNDNDEPQRHRSRRHKPRMYEEEEIVEKRGSGRAPRAGQQQLVRRHSDSDSSSIEEIDRDFPPGGGAYVKRKTTTREKRPQRPRSVHGYDNYDDHDRYGGGRGKPRRDKRRSRYDSDSDSESVSPPRKPERRKSLVEHALDAAGLGGVAGAALSGRDKDRGGRDDRARPRNRARSLSRGRGRYSDESDRSISRSRSKSMTRRETIMQAGKAAALAGVTEAWRTRKEPGGIPGNAKRIATAAIGAAGINGAIDRDPEHHSKRHILESAVGGVMGNRLINGRRESKSRSRSRGRNKEGGGNLGLGGAASAAGLAALAGKAYQTYRSKSRDRGRRGDSADSYDSRSPPRRSRSKSVQRYMEKGLAAGMAKLGLDNGAGGKQRGGAGGGGGRSREVYSDDDDYYPPRPRGGELQPINGQSGAVARTGGGATGAGAANGQQGQGQQGQGQGQQQQQKKPKDDSDSSATSDTDSYDSDKEIKKQKQMKNKQMITAGLASVATVHAAHSIYQSVEKRKINKKKVRKGQMTQDQASKLKNRARWGEAASVGIAALGIKSAVDEWREIREMRHEYHHACDRLEEKRQHRRLKCSSEPDLNNQYQGPQYNDANPYGGGDGGVPPPPMGNSRN